MRRGFTLIEVIITTAIVALLALSAFPFLNSYQSQLDLEEAALALQNCLVSAGDYSRAPSAGATAYRAVIKPAQKVCEVQRVAATTEVMDDYTFGGVDFSNSISPNLESFAMIVDTQVLHETTFEVIVAGSPVTATGTVVWTLTPAGKTAPTKNINVSVVHGIVTVSP